MPSTAPVPSPIPASAPPAAGLDLATPESRKRLRGHFLRAQSSEMLAVQHRHRRDLAQLASDQKAQARQWEKGAAAAGDPKTRARRRTAYLALQKDALRLKREEQQGQLSALREEQRRKRKAFDEALERGEVPATDLWPAAGR